MDRLEQLRNMRRGLEAQLQEVIRLIEEYEQLEAKVRGLLEAKPQNLASTIEKPTWQIFSGMQTRAKKPEVEEFEAVVRQILSEANAPMDRTEVLQAVRARGVTVGGAEPANTVSARLSRMDDVRSQRGVGYWLAIRADEFAKAKVSTPSGPDEENRTTPDPSI